MTEQSFFSVVLGAAIGWLIGQILLLFFKEEIFRSIDSAVKRVRKFFNLPI